MAPTSTCAPEKFAAINTEIRAALTLIQGAESAWAASDFRSALTLQDGADRACTSILRQITQLDEREADSIEFAFTRLEEKLLRLTRTLAKAERGSKCAK